MTPSDQEIESLLQELHSRQSDQRLMAVDELAALNVKTDEVIRALEMVAAQDHDRHVRQAALYALGRGAGLKNAISHSEKLSDFATGFIGWYGISILLWAFLPGSSSLLQLLALLCLPLHIVVLIVLGIKRRWMALGVLAAFAVNLAIATFMGMLFPAWCGAPFTVWTQYH